MNPNNHPRPQSNRRSVRPKALVTGATSGLGLESAAQLAADGYAPVVITGRTQTRAEAARAELVERTGLDVFTAVELDLSVPASVTAAVEQLLSAVDDADGGRFDLLVLNAGMVSGPQLTKTDDDVEITYASSLTGHHVLALGLLEGGGVAADGAIVIAGSEAARGDVPTFTPADLPAVAAEHYGGDLEAAAEGLMRHDGKVGYKPGNVYATAKLFVGWWAASLARQWPAPLTVLTVSPGSAPDTSAVRNANFFMRRIMVPVLRRAPRRFGLAASVPVAAARYADAVDFGPEATGRFYASAPGKMTGPLHPVELDHVHDRRSQDAAWNALVTVTGVGQRVTPAGGDQLASRTR